MIFWIGIISFAFESSLRGFVAISNVYKSNFTDHWACRTELSDPLEVLRWARGLMASNPRDKIFGLYGLSEELRSLIPLPDCSMSTAQVFTHVAKRYLNSKKSLRIL